MDRMRVAWVMLAAALALAGPAAGGDFLARDEPVTQGGAPGWPVQPLDEQHPVRGGFLDPRLDRSGPVYHNGLDISVRDDQPEDGHPPWRTHRVYALEGGTAWVPHGLATQSCNTRLVRIGHFGYGHVDPVGTVADGEAVAAGQLIGWSCKDEWHVHLSQWRFEEGERVWVNPLGPDRRVRPYVDTAPPEVRAIAFFRPVAPVWVIANNALSSGPVEDPVPGGALRGTVDARIETADVQSFTGWFDDLPFLAAEQTPYELRVSLARGGLVIWNRAVFGADELPSAAPFADRFAPGTVQNLPAAACIRVLPDACGGSYWFHLFPGTGWNTTALVNGAYSLCATALDAGGNATRSCAAVGIEN
jgi:hypothetical protein